MKVFLLLLLSIFSCDGKIPYNDVKSDYETLISAYKTGPVSQKNVIPKDPTSGPITVNLGIRLDAVMDFEGVNGRIHLIGSMQIEWLDEIKSLTGIVFKESSQTLYVSQDQIWTPGLVLKNSVDKFENIGDGSYIQYNISSGICKWNPKIVANAACKPNAKYFPFDQQTCALTVVPHTFNKVYLVLAVVSKQWDLRYLEPSGVWTVHQTFAEAYVNKNTSQYNVEFKIEVRRKPTFFVVFTVVPVGLISFLSAFVFLLPSESGTRVTFGILCFLAFISLQRMLLDLIPEASAPLPLLCYYIFVMMFLIGLVSVANLFIMRLYLKPEVKIPKYIKTIIQYVTCNACKAVVNCGFQNKVHIATEQAEGMPSSDDHSVNRKRPDTVFNTRYSSLSRPINSFDELPKGSDSSMSFLSECSLNDLKNFSNGPENEDVSESCSTRTDSVFNLRFTTQVKCFSELSEVKEVADSPGQEADKRQKKLHNSQLFKRESLFRCSSFIENRERRNSLFLARSKSCSDEKSDYVSGLEEKLDHLGHSYMVLKPLSSSVGETDKKEIALFSKHKNETDLLPRTDEDGMTRELVVKVLDIVLFIMFCVSQVIFAVAILVPIAE